MLGAVSEDDKHQLIDAWAAAIESYEHEVLPVIRLEHRRQKLQFQDMLAANEPHAHVNVGGASLNW